MLLELRATLERVLSRRFSHHPRDGEVWGLLVAVIDHYRRPASSVRAYRVATDRAHQLEDESRADAATSGK